MLQRIIRFVRQAGAKRESDHDRDGLLSYHAESHAAGVGLGIGWLLVVTGNMQLLALIVPAITAGLKAKNREFGTILTDVATEPHYTLGGLLVGVVFGIATQPFI